MTDSSKTPASTSEGGSEDVDKLLSHWVKKKSDSKSPGQFYYFNKKTKASVWTLEDLIWEEKLLKTQAQRISECLQNKAPKTTNEQKKEPILEKSISKKKRSKKKKKNKDLLNNNNYNDPKSSKNPSQPPSVPLPKETKNNPPSTSESRNLKRTHSQTNSPSSKNKKPCAEKKSSLCSSTENKPPSRPTEETKVSKNERIKEKECISSEDELMEVDDVDPGILQELRDLRRGTTNPGLNISFVEELKLSNSIDKSDSSSSITVVIDTNIFISHLSSIDGILSKGHRVHVPWTVFRELDLLKNSKRVVSEAGQSSEKMSFKARRAIHLLHRLLSSEDSKVFGQNGEEEKEASLLFRSSCPDDKILQCCLHLKKRISNVLLYSNDKNLLNKALLHKVSTASSSSLAQTLPDQSKEPPNAPSSPINSVSMDCSVLTSSSNNNLISASQRTPYDLKKDIIDEAKDLTHVLLMRSLVNLGDSTTWKSKLKGSTDDDPLSWSLGEAFKQVLQNWESIISPVLGDDTNGIKKELDIVESLLVRPRPLNKVWSLLGECLKSLDLFNSAINSSRNSYCRSSGRDIQIRIERLLKRIIGVESIGVCGELPIGGNIYECFNSIWTYVYAYATSYSVSIGLPLRDSIPSPKEISFVFKNITSEEIRHVNALMNESKALANKMEELLRVVPEELSTSSPSLLGLMDTMRKFIHCCSSFRPGGHPAADPLPKLVPRGLLQYAKNNETRELMMNGFQQLKALVCQLEQCSSQL